MSGKSRGRGGARDGRKTLPNGMAVAGFVLSLSTLLIGVTGGILGIVFGAIGLRRARRYPERYGRKKMAIAALIIGIVVTALTAVVIIAAIATI